MKSFLLYTRVITSLRIYTSVRRLGNNQSAYYTNLHCFLQHFLETNVSELGIVPEVQHSRDVGTHIPTKK